MNTISVLRVVQANRWCEAGIWGRLISHMRVGHILHGRWATNTNHVVYTEHLLVFWESGLGTRQAKGAYLTNKNPGHRVSTSFPGTQHPTAGMTICSWKNEVSVLCDSTGGGFLEACAWFPLDSTPCTFSL